MGWIQYGPIKASQLLWILTDTNHGFQWHTQLYVNMNLERKEKNVYIYEVPLIQPSFNKIIGICIHPTQKVRFQYITRVGKSNGRYL